MMIQGGESGGGGDPDACVGGEILGYNTIASGNSQRSDGSGSVTGYFTASCTGDLDTGYLYHGQAVDNNAKLCVYLDDGDGVPADSDDTLVGCSGNINTAAVEWSTSAAVSGSVTKDSNYWILIYANTGDWIIRRDSDPSECAGGSGACFTDYDSSCDGHANEYSEITGAGACSYPGDSGYVFSAYFTLGAP